MIGCSNFIDSKVEPILHNPMLQLDNISDNSAFDRGCHTLLSKHQSISSPRASVQLKRGTANLQIHRRTLAGFAHESCSLSSTDPGVNPILAHNEFHFSGHIIVVDSFAILKAQPIAHLIWFLVVSSPSRDFQYFVLTQNPEMKNRLHTIVRSIGRFLRTITLDSVMQRGLLALGKTYSLAMGHGRSRSPECTAH